MSLFSWLSGSLNSTKHTSQVGRRRNDSTALGRSGKQETDSSENSKNNRHARREELYVAIRESMTRSGVLSARFKFKVLSLDQQGNAFLVMVDLSSEAGAPAESLISMEQQIMRHALARFDIAVSSVYWRLGVLAARKQPGFQEPVGSHPEVVGAQRTARVYQTIEIDELAAFKEARLAAARRSPPAPAAAAATPTHRRSSRQPDFADTQLTESSNAPGLSATQYGDLN